MNNKDNIDITCSIDNIDNTHSTDNIDNTHNLDNTDSIENTDNQTCSSDPPDAKNSPFFENAEAVTGP